MRVLLVGVLTLVLSIDSASACRFLRNRCRPRCRPTSCHTLRPTTCRVAPSACATVGACDPCQGEQVVFTEVTAQCCVPADGSAHAVVVESESHPAEPTVAASEPVAHHPAPPSVAKQPPLESPKPTPLTMPHPPLEPVAPASAEKPVAEPQFKTAKEILAESAAKESETPPAAPTEKTETAADILADAEKAAPPMKEPAAPAEPIEPEEPQGEPADEAPADKEPQMEEDSPPAKAPDEAPAARKPVKKQEDNLFDEESDAAEEAPETPAEEPAAEAESDAESAPADAPSEDKKSDEPKTADDPFAAVLHAPDEPVRRWIDDTGSHETIGRLVEVHPDRVRILKSNGRYATVPLERLSHHDQSYVSATGERLAAERTLAPAATDTAAL